MTRVCVCSDRIAGCSPSQAGLGLARAFRDAARTPTLVALVPLAAGGEDLAEALDALGPPVRYVSGHSLAELAPRLGTALEGSPRVLVDLTGLAGLGPDAAAELLAALGGPEAAASSASGCELFVAVPEEDRSQRPLGADGVAARRGFEPRTPASEVQRVLRAMGGRVASGIDWCIESVALETTIAQADLVVVGTDAVHPGNAGGPVLRRVAALAGEAGVPCVVAARVLEVSRRELRAWGVQAGEALGLAVPASGEAVAAAARGFARSWLP